MAFESVRSYIQLASGLGEMTRARAMEAAQGLLSLPGADEVTRRAVQASTLADQLLEAARANRANLLALVQHEVESALKRAEVAFMLDRESWGNGYAQEAMTAVTAYAAGDGLRRLLARTQLGNRRSDNLLQKLGFQEEGLLKGYIERDGERRDCRLFGLLL